LRPGDLRGIGHASLVRWSFLFKAIKKKQRSELHVESNLTPPSRPRSQKQWAQENFLTVRAQGEGGDRSVTTRSRCADLDTEERKGHQGGSSLSYTRDMGKKKQGSYFSVLRYKKTDGRLSLAARSQQRGGIPISSALSGGKRGEG